jgi:hypothetical protein
MLTRKFSIQNIFVSGIFDGLSSVLMLVFKIVSFVEEPGYVSFAS